MAAVSLQRSNSALGVRFRRISRRNGYTVAVFAIARKLAKLVYRALRYRQDCVDIGAKRYEHQYRKQTVANLKIHAASLGYRSPPQATTETA